MRVLLADDNALLRQSLVGLLSGEFQDWSFLQTDTLEQAKEHLSGADGENLVDLLVIDLPPPGTEAFAGIRALRENYRTLRVAILTTIDDRETILRGLAAGVHGYILKTDTQDQFVRAMKLIASGGIYVPPLLSDITKENRSTTAIPNLSASTGLTNRQRRVLALLTDGQSTKDIARSLNLGIGTVKVHLACAYRMLGVRNRTEAVARFRNSGIC